MVNIGANILHTLYYLPIPPPIDHEMQIQHVVLVLLLGTVGTARAFAPGTMPTFYASSTGPGIGGNTPVSRFLPVWQPTSRRGATFCPAMAAGDFLPEHPDVRSLSADAFAAAPPALRTVVVDQHDETHAVMLLWSPKGEVFADNAAQHEGEILVGKLLFKEGIPGKFERTMGGLVAHLDQVVVLKGMRGHGGGDMLVQDMVDALSRGVGRGAKGGGYKFVALRHTDLGSGKLVNWYNQLGFVKGAEYRDDLVKSGPDLMIAELPTLLERVQGVRF